MQLQWELTIDMASSLRAVRKLVVELAFTHCDGVGFLGSDAE